MSSVWICCQAFTTAAIICIPGCASIMSGRHAEVAIDSYPSNAHVVVRDRQGQEVASVNTPGKVTLKRKERIIYPARYTASIEAPGYRSEQVPIRSTLNPWILGNVVVGGIPGLVVDNVTGAVWRPRELTIYRQLAPVCTVQQPPTQLPPAAVTPQMAAVPSDPSKQRNLSHSPRE